jgi:arylamine N-acetyltransferase
MITRKATIKTLIITALIGAFANSAMATETHWQQNHPRRVQVNHRLANQHHRIDQKVANGTMSPARAARLHRDDRLIRREERAMAHQNGGHITKQEQRTLNHQENVISKRIGA